MQLLQVPGIPWSGEGNGWWEFHTAGFEQAKKSWILLLP